MITFQNNSVKKKNTYSRDLIAILILILQKQTLKSPSEESLPSLWIHAKGPSFGSMLHSCASSHHAEWPLPRGPIIVVYVSASPISM